MRSTYALRMKRTIARWCELALLAVCAGFITQVDNPALAAMFAVAAAGVIAHMVFESSGAGKSGRPRL